MIMWLTHGTLVDMDMKSIWTHQITIKWIYDSSHQKDWFNVVMNAIEILVEVSFSELENGFRDIFWSTTWVNSR